ncbi:MAG: hypothetical protein M1819_001236 [Sarea resinae]|nr:MAG: hypothetical protein M1819_001236 [Sarea resinae]
MAMWPFGRKGRRTESEKDTRTGKGRRAVATSDVTTNSSTPQGLKRAPSRKASKRKSNKPARLTKTSQRAQEKESRESLPSHPEKEKATASAQNDKSAHSADRGPNVRDVPHDRSDIPSYYFQNPGSRYSLPAEYTMPREPTLRAKRSANESALPRRKLSKKKKRDHDREEEIKAMSAPIPIPKRPVSHSGGLLRRDSKKRQGGVNRLIDRPASDVSLQFPGSARSSLSSMSDQHEFKVRALDVFSPRPTIRYSDSSRYATGSGTWGPSRSDSRKEKQPVIPEEVIQPNRKIEDLADGLDAGALRELMERDQRRREKKRKDDQERAQLKLLRRAEKQKVEEEKQNMGGSEIPGDGVQGQHNGQSEDVTMGFGHDSATGRSGRMSMDSETMPKPADQNSWLQDASKERLSVNPFADQEGGANDSNMDVSTTPAEDQEEPVISTAQAVQLSQASMNSPPTSPQRHNRGASNVSRMTELPSRSTPDVSEQFDQDRRDSDTSARQASTWSSFFRRGGAKAKRGSADRGRATPSEFSNTSRESMSRQPPPAHLTRGARARSGTPVRTQSKFREDLPELPISPPDSRVQFPEATFPSRSYQPDRYGPVLAEKGSIAESSFTSRDPFADPSLGPRNESPISGYRSIEVPSPEGRMPSTVLSQSLASVDSEGSWLSGKPVKRISQQTHPLRQSASSLQRKYDEMSQSDEELGVAEDEYFSRLTPGPDTLLGYGQGPEKDRKPSSTLMAETDRKPSSTVTTANTGDDGDASEMDEGQGIQSTWHHGLGRHPTVVHQGARARSRHGLLNDFQEGEASVEQFEAETPPETPFVQDATSLDFSKSHVRHMSAGSAKLLDIPRRTSVDQRNSSEQNRMSLG